MDERELRRFFMTVRKSSIAIMFLMLCRREPVTVRTIKGFTCLSGPTVKDHLRFLAACGLVIYLEDDRLWALTEKAMVLGHAFSELMWVPELDDVQEPEDAEESTAPAEMDVVDAVSVTVSPVEEKKFFMSCSSSCSYIYHDTKNKHKKLLQQQKQTQKRAKPPPNATGTRQKWPDCIRSGTRPPLPADTLYLADDLWFLEGKGFRADPVAGGYQRSRSPPG